MAGGVPRTVRDMISAVRNVYTIVMRSAVLAVLGSNCSG